MKIKIAMLIALLLLVAMTLLDMVMVFAAQQLLVKCERQKAVFMIEMIGARMADSGEGEEDKSLEDISRRGGREILAESNAVSAVWMSVGGETRWIQGVEAPLQASLARILKTAMRREAFQVEMTGKTWGVFWRQKKYLNMAGPVYDEDRMIGVAGVALGLGTVFSQLRSVQKFIGTYLLINMVILTLLGIYRINHLAIRPILKIIGRAEAFRPGDAEFLPEETGEDELSRLSKSINRVFDLNRDDQEVLRKTVFRLEEAMAKLKQAQQEIVRAEKLATVGRLASGVAHEIGNPIGIVMGYMELIKPAVDEADGETRDYIRRAEDEMGRIRSVIRQLLDYSRPTDEMRKTVSIHEILRETIQMVRIQPLFSEIAVYEELSADEDNINGDENQLKQLFLNFIINAADAVQMSPKDMAGRIAIRTQLSPGDGQGADRGRDMLMIEFEDNGAGIAEADLNRIFDPFFTTKPTGKGSGLGLWVSLLIAEAMGGKIDVDTEEGRGTKMTLVFPLSMDGKSV